MSQPSDHRRVGDAPGELPRGHVVAGRYRVEGKLGTGGIGIVYRAAQLPLERPVAVKVLHEDLLELRDIRARFEREARALSALSHPHVVAISDYGIDGDRPFLVMELLEGEPLEEVVRKDPLEPVRGLAIAREVLRGLAFAHKKGIAHRDLKPANVFLVRMADGIEHAKLLDFGLARMVETEGPDDVAATLLTKRGVVFGTPAYMSPEQASGAPADERSDVYSMGVLLFELLAGRRPFVAETRPELLRAHLIAPVPKLASVRPTLRVSPALAELIEIAMAKEAEDRFANAGEMLEALEAIAPPVAWLVPEDEVSEAPTQMAGPPVPRPPRPRGRKRSRSFVGPLSIALVIACAAAAWVVWPDLPRTIAARLGIPYGPHATASRDPWAEPPPEPLVRYVRMVERGRPFRSTRQIRPLYALAREMPGDPRPLLLLGHLFAQKGWLTEALARYETALDMDPSVRGDPRLLTNLVMIASRDNIGARASRSIERHYGDEATDAVEAQIAVLGDRPIAQLRLVRLRDRLQR